MEQQKLEQKIDKLKVTEFLSLRNLRTVVEQDF